MLLKGATSLPGRYTFTSKPPRQQITLAPRWPNVDPVGSTLDQRGLNVPCYLGFVMLNRWNALLKRILSKDSYIG